MSGLRDLKRSGGYVVPRTGPGIWRVWQAGRLARCPYSDCGRAFILAFPNTVIKTRIPPATVISDSPLTGGTVTCRECRRRFEADFGPADRTKGEPEIG
jgi:hypothetical protein